MDLKKLLTRTMSGIIYVAIIVGCVLWGYIGIAILGIFIAMMATYEFENICKGNDEKLSPLLFSLDVSGVIFLSLSGFIEIPVISFFLWIVIVMVRMIAQLYIKEKNSLQSLGKSMMAQIYLGLPLAAMSVAAFLLKPAVILVVFLMLWINDTGAYLIGSLMGRHRLFERISPKKSWEGFFGGLLFNIIASILFYRYDPGFAGIKFNLPQWVAMGVIVTVFGTWGDLIESMIKRFLNIKDSGNIIPGHGGILDRIDSFLLAMPAVFVYVVLILLL